MSDFIFNWLTSQGVPSAGAAILKEVISLGLIFIMAFSSYFIAKGLVVRGIGRLALNSENKWDDILVERKAFAKFAALAPALTFYFTIPRLMDTESKLSGFLVGLSLIYIIIVSALAVHSLFNVSLDIYSAFPVSREIPVKSFIQFANILLYSVALILIASVVFNKSPIYLLSGLGALTAVLLLIFKDAILGLGAGIQLILNRMVAGGDWIEMPKYGADGEVVEVSLTTVAVRNWDKTITSIPAYALIGDSFKNWRGMQESGGRRIKRSILIDMNSVKFCDSERLRRFFSIPCLAEYVKSETKSPELNEDGIKSDEELSDIVKKLFFDAREPVTNLGIFRAYAAAYLKAHPLVNQEMTFLVRQLSPTEHGLPLEIYVFSKDQVWANYETIQAEIFERLLAMLPEFELKVFQSPGGSDLREISSCKDARAGLRSATQHETG